ncbi:MAG: succinylglutamate desuccinylase/aspartoacylase family protein [Planctomycetaceae bacterium]|nr:succinylglutamate desuccinylase/aspartoacylase family protein [Planctomycetaceae bacterium]
MGQEIANTHFKHFDFHRFDEMVRKEMDVLQELFDNKRFSTRSSIAGLELEAWLVDDDAQPTPWNEQLIAATGNPEIVPELARFNIEFNVPPRPLTGRGLEELAVDLDLIWKQCEATANRMGSSVLAIGVLPTIRDTLLSLENMSNLMRYRALNEQVLRMRQGTPIRLDIAGRDSLKSEHHNLMLESAATSFQLHLQVPLSSAARYYNASLIASAATVAVAANSPLLFGSVLWEETRIPLFEQAVNVGRDALPRVTFGSDYVRESLFEVFLENRDQYPVLLPLSLDKDSEYLPHLRLLNGTIWRWNRPLIGFDEDQTPHLRVEHRVMAAGPTLVDMTANMALYYGLAENLATESIPPETRIPFDSARNNFYQAARHGLDASIRWLDGSVRRLGDLILSEILPRAAQGLSSLNVDSKLATNWLSVLEARVQSGQTGSAWQRQFLENHDNDLITLTRTYRQLQQQGDPVHTWPVQSQSVPPTIRIRPSMLEIIDHIPTGFLTVRSDEMKTILGQPTLIHLPGRNPDPLFVSILLHGNEDVGLRAIQNYLQRFGEHPLPRSLSIFVGNVEAALHNVRRLPDQPDYNRIWPGSDQGNTPEHAIMRHVVAEMRRKNVFASIDLHNNTGWNPHYGCVTLLQPQHLQLAALFSRTAVFFQHPKGVQTMAFADICPSLTCECGKVGDAAGVQHAADFVEACLHLDHLPQQNPAPSDLHLFHTTATVKLASPRLRICFLDVDSETCPPDFDLALRSDLDRLNFQELKPGQIIGSSRSRSQLPLTVTDQLGQEMTASFLELENGNIILRQPAIPAMLTCNEAVIRQDCLGYLMERYPLPAD